MINFCLLGYGTVGKSFLINFFRLNKFDNLRVLYIIFKKNNIKKKRSIEQILKNNVFLFISYRNLLKYNNIKIFIDLSGKNKILKNILFLSNKIIITANKNFISLNYKKIYKIINKRIFIEACVFGGCPIINNLIEHYKFIKIKKIYNIINGTTNFILDNIFRKNKKFNKSLQLCKKQGISEKHPVFDLSGLDTYYKTYIILNLLKTTVKLKTKYIIGILKINQYYFNCLKKKNKNLKLIGKIQFKKIFFSIEVFPYVFKNNFVVKGEYNFLKIFTNCGNYTNLAKGAGGNPTSISVLNNLFNICKKNNVMVYNKLEELDFTRSKLYIIIKKKKKYYKKFFFKTVIDRVSNKRFFFLKKKLNIYFYNMLFKLS
ncbi:hypothetical protein [Candidatus Vidania fulgoroideorum]